MKLRHVIAAVLLALAVIGCEPQDPLLVTSPFLWMLSGTGSDSGSDDDGIDPGIPRVYGSWTGRYYREDSAYSEPVSAEVRQFADTITIETTKIGVGHLFTGTIRTNGSLHLTDAFDGEFWTTPHGPATPHSIVLCDYLRTPTPGSWDPMQIIELSR